MKEMQQGGKYLGSEIEANVIVNPSFEELKDMRF